MEKIIIKRKLKPIYFYMEVIESYLEKNGFSISDIFDKKKYNDYLINLKSGCASIADVYGVLNLIEKRINQPYFWLGFGRFVSLPVHGSFGLSIMLANNIQQAFSIVESYMAIRVPFVQIEMIDNGNDISLFIKISTSHKKLDNIFMQCALGSVVNAFETLYGYSPDLRVYINDNVSSSCDAYSRILGCPVSMTCQTTRIDFSRDLLDKNFVLSNKSSYEFFLKQCQKENLELTSSNSYIDVMESILRAAVSVPVDEMGLKVQTVPTMVEMSQLMGVSERTLRRKLHDNGLSYRAVLAGVRLNKAKEYLRNESVTIEKIAYSLGYSSASNFRVAFKEWTGKTPSEWP